ncbi:reverse transcriptase family protein [Enterococcus sp. LJL99]
MNWEEYEIAFREKNSELNRFSQSELENKLRYAKNIYENRATVIYDAKHLAELVGVKYFEVYKIANSNSRFFYKEFLLQKKNGGERKIKAPLPTLNIIQKWIFENILANLKCSVYCKSYQKNLSLKDNAKFHRRQPILMKLDISSFFDDISWGLIYNIFKNLGYSVEVSTLITKLVMYTENGKVKGIPQGAISSPMLSNLVLKKFDENIGYYCVNNKIRYTRYADDLTFSGNFDTYKLKTFVNKELHKNGFLLNNRKTKILKSNDRQVVTGIVVNEKMQVSRKYRKNLRLEIYHLLFRTQQHFEYKKLKNYDEKSMYLKTIIGKVNFVLQVNSSDKEFKTYKKEIYKIIDSINNSELNKNNWN